MASKKENIDQLFKKGLNNRSFEIPASFEDNLNQGLDLMEKKKRRGFVFWIIVFACILDFTVLSIILIGNTPSPNYSVSHQRIEPAKSQPISGHSQQLNKKNSKEPNSKQTSSIQAKEVTLTKNSSENPTVLNSSPLLENKEEKAQEDENTDKLSTSIERANENLSSSKNTATPNLKKTNPERSKTKHLDKRKKSSHIKENDELEKFSDKDTRSNKGSTPSEIKDLEQGNKGERSISNKVNQTAPTKKNEKDFTLESLTEGTNEQSKIDTNEVRKTTDQEKKSTSSDIKDVEKKEDGLSEEENNNLHQRSPKVSNWKAEIQLYAGFGGNLINDDANKEYLGEINENRKPLNAPTFGFNGNISYNNITFGLGLSYLQTGETYSTKINTVNFTDVPYTVLDTTVETITYYEPFGVEIGDSSILTVDSTTETKSVANITTDRQKIKNKYTWISVPVYFGYHFSFGKYELTPRVGAQFNFGITENKGEYPISNFEAVSTINAARFNVSYLINLEVKRNFNNWSIFIRPYFKSMINPAINEDMLKRKYSSWGLQVGVGFDL